jgi:hypothetical protein
MLAAMLSVAGLLPGAAVAAATASPAGFTVACRAEPLADALVHMHDVIHAYGSGRCTLTGSLGAPWILDLAVRIQQKVDGVWRTRADGYTATSLGGATKSIDVLDVSLDCTGPVRFPSGKWRYRVVVRAYASEKTITVLKRKVADSGVTTFAC